MQPIRDNNSGCEEEIKGGKRFGFGDNWRHFLSIIDENKIRKAENSLQEMLDINTFAASSFIDIGSGSGLFSLAARRLGATVHSFDYDPASVRCTAELRERYFKNDPDWIVEQGSILDENYVSNLPKFDVVYSWGVLHHTGHMWEALNVVTKLVVPRGKLFLALYNDQGILSKIWHIIKRVYCFLPKPFKPVILIPLTILMWGPITLSDVIKFKPLHSWRAYCQNRGMSPFRDMIDWVGGYPYEVSKPREIIEFYSKHGFTLVKLKTTRGLGNNQFVFKKA